MFGLEEHAGYILGAYAGVATVTLGIIAMTMLGSSRAKAQLGTLEAQGVRRRSDPAKSDVKSA
jgi:hypothetical protein